jgi:integrase
MHNGAFEVVGAVRAALAAFVPARIEHEVVDDELPTETKEIEKCRLPGRTLEDVPLVHLYHRLREPKRLPKYLTIPDQERVLATLAVDRTLIGLRDYALIATGFFCGLRVAEFAGLRREDVDLDAGLLGVIGKGDKQRECVVIPRLNGYLAGLRTSREFVAENRDYFNRAREAVMAKITENPAAAAALKGNKSPLLTASAGNVPDLDKAFDRLASR